MNKKQIITSGQFFTLLFICRMSLTLLYSSKSSGIISLRELILPLMISVPVMLFMLVPAIVLISSEKEYAAKHINADINTGALSSGKAVSFLYGIYFLLSSAYGTLTIYDFMNDVIPSGVNSKIILSFMVIGCIYAAIKGIEAVSRMSLIVLILFILAIIIIAVYLFPSYSASKLTPAGSLFSLSVSDGIIFLISRMNAASAIGVFHDSIKGSIKKGLIIYTVISVVFTILSVLLLCGSAGNYLDKQDFQIFRSIDASSVLQRIDPFFILVAVCSIFCEITLFILAASKCISFSFNKLNEKKSAFIVGAALVIFVLLIPFGKTPEFFFDKYIWAGAAVLFITVLPSIILINKKLRHKNNRKKRIAGAAAIGMTIAMTLLLTGCSSVQLNNRIIVQGIGIDKDPEGYKLTLIVLNTDDPQKENALSIVYSEGSSVEKAMASLEQQRGKRLLLNQCLFIAMNQPACKDSKNTLDYFSRSNDIPRSLDLIAAEEGAETTLNTAIKEFGYKSEDISAICGSSAVEQNNVRCTLLEYISRSDNGTDTAFPLITIDKDIKALRICGSSGVPPVRDSTG